jgi:hypothetical protein
LGPSNCISNVSTTPNQMQTSQVYAVIGGYQYEGEVFDTLKLFDCKSAAEKYKEELQNDCDYVLMKTKEVIMESAIAVNTSNLNTKDGITTPW